MKNKLLYDYFYYKAFTTNSAVSVMIELLTKCNLKCEHCYLPGHNNPGLETEMVTKLLKELKRMGVVNVSFTGGEIFLREDIFKIIETARRLHMRVFLLSNGTLLNENIVRHLSELNIAEFSTTIFSMNPDTHDCIAGKTGALNAVLDSIELLKREGIPVRVKTPIMKKNAVEFRDVQRYCENNGFEYRASPLIFSRTDGDTSPKNLRVEEKALIDIMKDVDTTSRSDHLHISDVPCAALFYSFAIDHKGDVYPCNSFFYKVGNIYEESVEQIWNESSALKYIKSIRNSDLSECHDCEYIWYCDRCPGMVFMENNDLLSCDKFSRSLARIRKSGYRES